MLVTGANRGIGLEFTKQYLNLKKRVIACCRDLSKAVELTELASNSDLLSIHEIDIRDQSKIDYLAKTLSSQTIDYLINNAGIYGERKVGLGSIDRKNFLDVMDVNCLGTLKVSEAFFEHISKSEKKIVVTISSQMGSITDNDSGGAYAYRASKAALNAVMRSFALDVQSYGINALTLHPGWVQTDMGGGNAFISPKESVSGMIAQIEKFGDKDLSQVFRRFDGKTVMW